MADVDLQGKFTQDWNALVGTPESTGAAQAELAAKQAHDADLKYYRETVLAKLDALKSGTAILVYLEAFVFASVDPDHQGGTVLGVFGDSVATKGKALKVNSLLSQVHDDIQNIVNSNVGTYPYDSELVKDSADDLNKILDALGNPASKLSLAMNDTDPGAVLNIQTTDTKLRGEFFINGDENNPVPTFPTTPPVPGSFPFYFTYGEGKDNGYMVDFHQMQEKMKLAGDPCDATEAFKGFTDNFSADNSLSQTVSASVNEMLTQLSNEINGFMGFLQNGVLAPTMKLSATSIGNEKTQ